jgi:DNA-binding transcriptional MerR regulator
MNEARQIAGLAAAAEAARGPGIRPFDVVRISAVMDALGVSARAVRFYEERGLIAPRRDRRNRRIYDAATRERLSLITGLRRAGVGLDDIRDLLLRAPSGDWKGRARELLLRRRGEVQQALAAVDAAIGTLGGPSEIKRRSL